MELLKYCRGSRIRSLASTVGSAQVLLLLLAIVCSRDSGVSGQSLAVPGLPRCLSYPTQCCGKPQCLDTQSPTFLAETKAYSDKCGDPKKNCHPFYYTVCSLNSTSSQCQGSGVYTLPTSRPGVTTSSAGRQDASSIPLCAISAAICALAVASGV
eukprot:scpid89368/ scgid0864/ 